MKALTDFLTYLLLLVMCISLAYAQETTPSKASKSTIRDTTKNITDTTKVVTQDSIRDSVVVKNESGLQSTVSIVAVDSQYTQVDKNITYLYKGAKVKYQDFELSADFIRPGS